MNCQKCGCEILPSAFPLCTDCALSALAADADVQAENAAIAAAFAVAEEDGLESEVKHERS